MSDDYKKKLQDYMDGKLSVEEEQKMEIELEKLEAYQEVLDSQLQNKDEKAVEKDLSKVIKKSKWKARIQTAFTAIPIFLGIWMIVALLGGGGTNFYYWNKQDTIRDIANAAIQTTMPNMRLNGGTGNQGFFLNYNLTSDVVKQVGGDSKVVGDVAFDFRLMSLSNYKMNQLVKHDTAYVFDNPKDKEEIRTSDWSILEKLPEGTVVEAYITLNDFYGTDAILKKLEKIKIDPLWFAVYTEDSFTPFPSPFNVVGFPYRTLWFEDDWIPQGESTGEKTKTGWFTSMQSHTSSSAAPMVEDYGSGDLRDKQFIKTLKILSEHQQLLDKMGKSNKIEPKLEYIEKNGVKIYGLVVTGPTKELLALKNETWIQSLQVTDTALWNYRE